MFNLCLRNDRLRPASLTGIEYVAWSLSACYECSIRRVTARVLWKRRASHSMRDSDTETLNLYMLNMLPVSHFQLQWWFLFISNMLKAMNIKFRCDNYEILSLPSDVLMYWFLAVAFVKIGVMPLWSIFLIAGATFATLVWLTSSELRRPKYYWVWLRRYMSGFQWHIIFCLRFSPTSDSWLPYCGPTAWRMKSLICCKHSVPWSTFRMLSWVLLFWLGGTPSVTRWRMLHLRGRDWRGWRSRRALEDRFSVSFDSILRIM